MASCAALLNNCQTFRWSCCCSHPALVKWDWVPQHCPVCALQVWSLGQSPVLRQRANPEEELGKTVLRRPTDTVQPSDSPLSRISPRLLPCCYWKGQNSLLLESGSCSGRIAGLWSPRVPGKLFFIMAWRACSSSPAKTCSPSSHKDKESDCCCSTASNTKACQKYNRHGAAHLHCAEPLESPLGKYLGHLSACPPCHTSLWHLLM